MYTHHAHARGASGPFFTETRFFRCPIGPLKTPSRTHELRVTQSVTARGERKPGCVFSARPASWPSTSTPFGGAYSTVRSFRRSVRIASGTGTALCARPLCATLASDENLNAHGQYELRRVESSSPTRKRKWLQVHAIAGILARMVRIRCFWTI